MHPEIARTLMAQHNDDLRNLARGGHSSAAGRRAIGRRLTLPRPAVPLWRVTWSRLAAPATGKRGRTWLIVISTTRRLA